MQIITKEEYDVVFWKHDEDSNWNHTNLSSLIEYYEYLLQLAAEEEDKNRPATGLDNRNCYWCDTVLDEETDMIVSYCTYNPHQMQICAIGIPCQRYCDINEIDEYIRYLQTEVEKVNEE